MKGKGLFAIAILALALWVTSAWADEDSPIRAYPIEDSIRHAAHLMVGMFGYSQEEAMAMRYEATIKPGGSIATDVRVYPLADSDDHFDLVYWSDGALDESRIRAARCYAIPAEIFSHERAIQAAYHLMIGLYGFDPQVAAQFRYEAISPEHMRAMHVSVYPFPETDAWGDERFNLLYTENGTLLSNVLPDILDFSPFYDMCKEVRRPFRWLTHEERAAYSKEYIRKEEALLRINPSSNDALYNYAFTRCVYGVPDASVLLEADALEIARVVLRERFGRSDEWTTKAGLESYFDVTDPEKPLWKFFFSHYDSVEQKQYVIRLDAKTGEIVKAFEWNDDYEMYERY